MSLENYKTQINGVDFKSDRENNQDDQKSRILAEAKLDEMHAKLQKWTISQEDFDNFFVQITELMKKQDADINTINTQFEKVKNEIIKKSAQAIKDWKQETLVTWTFKKLFYFPLGIEEDLWKNNELQNYSKWVIDELMALPEVVELLATNSQARSQLIEAFKNLRWEQIKNSFHISVENAYEAWRATVFSILMLSWIWALLKTWSKLIWKIAKAKPTAAAPTAAAPTAAAPTAAAPRAAAPRAAAPRAAAPTAAAPTAAPLSWKSAEEASKLRLMWEKAKTPWLADVWTAEVRWILNKTWRLTPDELTKLDTRRALLNKEASNTWISPQRLEAINKEVNLIERRIRNSQSWLNWAADSARVFDSKATPSATTWATPWLTWKSAEEASKLRLMWEKAKTPWLADVWTAEVRWILNKGWRLTPDELTKLDTRRALLNKEASTSWVTPQRLEAINKEVNLIERRIRNSQSWLNWAADSARVFDSEIAFWKLSNDVLKWLDISKLWWKEFTQAFDNWLTRNYKIVNISWEYKIFVQDAKTSKFVLATEWNGIPKWQARANFDARIWNEIKSWIKPTSQSELLIALDVSKIGWKEFTQAFENWLTRNYKIVNISWEYKVFVQDAKTSKFVLATEWNGIPKWQARANFDARISNEIAQINKKWVATKDILLKNWALNDADRLAEASRLLWVELTDIQKQTLFKAHNIEQWKNIVKWRILMKDGVFTREQAQLLMDNWIAWRFTDIAQKSSWLLSSPKAVTERLNSLLINLKWWEKIVKIKEAARATITETSKQLKEAKLALKEAKKTKEPALISQATSKVDELTTALKDAKKVLKEPENFIDRPIKYWLITATLIAAHLQRWTRIDASEELLLADTPAAAPTEAAAAPTEAAAAPTEAAAAPTEAAAAPTEAAAAPTEAAAAPTAAETKQKQLSEAIQYNRRYTPEQIKTIQQVLWFTGAELDGKVWPKTVDAIRAFQALKNIVRDGKAWPETFDKMWYRLKDNSLIPLDWVSHWTPTWDSNQILTNSEKEDKWKEKNKSYFTKNGLQIGDQVEFYPTWGNLECITWILSQDDWYTYIIRSWGEEYIIDDLEKSKVRKQPIPEKKWELQPSLPILENPWHVWSDQAKAWNMLTDAQKKWIGWADPTDQYIISRMPEKI